MPATTAITAAVLNLSEVQAFDPKHPQRSGETDACCPSCGLDKPVDATHRSLSYNGQTGLYRCHRCHIHGQFKEFWKEQGAEARTKPNNFRRSGALRRMAVPARSAEPPVAAPDESFKSRIGALVALHGTPAESYLSGRGLPAGFCQSAGVRFKADFFGHPAAMFPLRNKVGDLIAAQGRYTNGFDKPKARTVGPKKLGVFATPGALDTGAPFLCITEAPIDALTLAFCGVPAIALCGCDGVPEWLRTVSAFRTILAAYDADDAGDKASGGLAAMLSGVGADVRRLRPDGAKDWNQILTEKGAAWLRSYLLPRTYPFPIIEEQVSDAEGAEITPIEDPTEEWSDETYRAAVRGLYADSLAFALPVESVDLPCPHPGIRWRTENPNITAIVAIQKGRALREQHSDGWLETADGVAIMSVINGLVKWWYGLNHDD